MSNEKQLATKTAELSVVEQPSIGGMLQRIIESGITPDNAMAVEKMLGVWERMEDRNKEQSFNKAFCELQAEMTGVKATQVVPNKDGTTRYKFAPFASIMATVQPLLKKHGFSVTFNQSFEGNRVKITCILRHVDGHSASNDYAASIGSGPPGASTTQADGSAITYAKRGALTNALNIVVEHDDDARDVGATITPEEAEELRSKVKATKTDEGKFFKWLQVADYHAIGSAQLAMAREQLANRAMQQAAQRAKREENNTEGEDKW